MTFAPQSTTEEARSFAEAAIRELTDLQALILKWQTDLQSWTDLERGLRDGLPAVQKLAIQGKLEAAQNVISVQGASEPEKLAALKELASGLKLLAQGRIGRVQKTATYLRGALQGGGMTGNTVLDDLTQKANEQSWAALEQKLAQTFSDCPELPQRLFEYTRWTFPLAHWEHVRAAEAKEINALRVKRGLREEEEGHWFGLAFSGGGIRSATFNLGILQGLAHQGLLEKVDILSTVSGGGYIGSWLAAWIKRERMSRVQEQLASAASLKKTQPESIEDDDHFPTPIRRLRQYSNYLTPSMGVFSIDTWTAVAVYLRNVFLNQITLAALIGAVMLLPRFLVFSLVQAAGSETTFVRNLILIAALVLIAVAVALVSFNLRRVIFDTGQAAAESPKSVWSRITSLDEVGVQIWCVSSVIAGVTLASIWCWLNIRNNGLQTIGANAFWLGASLFFFALSFLITVFGGSFECVNDRANEQTRGAFWFKLRNYLLLVAAMFASSAVALGLLRGYLAILSAFHAMPGAGPWHAVVWSSLLLMLVLDTAAILHVGLLGTYMRDVGREWLTRFRAISQLWLFFWSALASAAIYGPFLVVKLGSWLAGTLTIGWVVATITSLRAGQSVLTGKSEEGKPSASPMDLVAKIGPPVFLVGFLLFISLGEHMLLSYPKIGNGPLTLKNLADHHWQWLNPSPMWLSHSTWPLAAPGSLFVILAAAGLILAWRVDINEFSMHHFYKNRLVRCYLGASNRKREPNPFTKFDPEDDISLCELKASNGYTGPYHIINTTLNLSAGDDLAWQERKGASFIFSPAYCGFNFALEKDSLPSSGELDTLANCAYRDTRYYAYPKGVPLGTAFAISGAAADPNQGYNTSPTVAFFMTVFDVRLGWWLGNPRRNAESSLPGPRFGLMSLISELLGRTDDQTRFVSLSDGGHFDNMALYELVRRRCRYIVLCDGEQDGDYKFEGLGTAIRKCRIDFGVEIDIDPRAIIPAGDPRRSESHCAVGTIRYDANTEGTLLYIKASLTGDEPKDVLQYASTSATFPHQTTADQWFTESQFESYRALGFQALNASIEPAKIWTGVKGTSDVRALFNEGLRSCWYPPTPGLREHATRHTATLSQLFTRIASDEDLHELGHKLFSVHPEFGPGGIHSPEEFYFVMVLLQLVEDVYFDFELERTHWQSDPRIGGWIKLFELWASSKIVKDVWSSKKDTFRKDFQNFWDELARRHAISENHVSAAEGESERHLSRGAGGG